jgi:DNA-binding response OmpR family regulator
MKQKPRCERKVKTPILILSGFAGIDHKVRELSFGTDDYMTKPFHKDRHHAHQGDVPQPPLRRHGRARTQDRGRFHVQAAQEACQRVERQELHRDGLGPRRRLAGALED